MIKRILPLLLCAILLVTTACGPKQVVSEDFSAANDNWFVEADPIGQTAIANGQLFVVVNEPNTMQFATLRQPLLDDFDLEVDGTLLAGPANSSYGVLFRMQEGGAFYRFEITGKGQYIVEKRNRDSSWNRLNGAQAWVPSNAIRQGLNVTNRIKVAANGQTLVFSVNGEVLERFEEFDTIYKKGTIGLDAGSFTQGGVQVAFDNLTISQP